MTIYEFVQWYMEESQKRKIPRTVADVMRAYEGWKDWGYPDVTGGTRPPGGR